MKGFKIKCVISLMLAAFCMNGLRGQEVASWAGKFVSEIPERELNVSYRDSLGYMWYGTSNSLYRDDGYRVVSFQPEGASIAVNSIAEGPGNKIWVVADEGVFIIDRLTGKFTELDPKRIKGNMAELVFFSSDGMAWIAQQGVLRRYDSNGKWQKDYVTVDRRGKPTRMSGFCETRQGDIWISTYSRGLLKYDKSRDTFTMKAPLGHDASLGKIIQDADRDYLWVADHDGYIYRFNPKNIGSPDAFVGSPVVTNDGVVSKDRVMNFIQDNTYGYLWVQTRTNLLAFAPDSEGHLKWVPESNVKFFPGPLITTISKLNNGLMVTCYNGLDYMIELGEQTMEFVPVAATHERYGNTATLTAVSCKKNSSLLWMLQSRSGLVLFDPVTGRISDHDQESNMLSHRLYRADNLVNSNTYDGVWVSRTHENVVYAVSNQGMVMQIRDSLKLPDITAGQTKVTSMLEDSKSGLWVGASGGLYSFDIARHHLSGRFPTLGKVIALSEGRDGDIWAATADKGLFRIRRGSKMSVESVGSPNHYTGMSLAADGNIWLATANGKVMEYNPADGSWTDHTKILGLEGKPLLQIYNDALNHVWLVSNQRVVEYNPKNSAYKVYYPRGEEGRGAFLSKVPSVDSLGNLTVGGLGGVYHFKPSSALDAPAENISTYISNVKVNGKSIFFSDSNRYNPGKKEVVLEPSDSHIEIEFSILNPRFSNDVRYRYRLKGLEKEWHTTSHGENVAYYNNLPKGNYVFEVMSCDDKNIWSKKVATFNIKQEPYFYNTWWAWTIYVLIGAGALTVVIFYFINRAKKRNEEIWTDSQEMIAMRKYLSSPVSLPEEEFRELDRVLLEKATKVVEANMSRPEFDVNKLAEGVNMSRSSLARKLKAITDRTPLEFIRHIKMQHACRLLESQNHTVAEVAERVGFEDRRYFTTSFKKDIGVTPSAYLKGERAPQKQDETDSAGDKNESEEG